MGTVAGSYSIRAGRAHPSSGEVDPAPHNLDQWKTGRPGEPSLTKAASDRWQTQSLCAGYFLAGYGRKNAVSANPGWALNCEQGHPVHIKRASRKRLRLLHLALPLIATLNNPL